MPDQSKAAEEHALLTELTQPMAALPPDPPAAEVNVDFPVVLRGYDRFAVDAYVKKVGRQIADLQAAHSPDAAVRRALERVGEEVSGILQRAHDTAERITGNSRREAEDRLERARAEAAELVAAAQERLRALDAETDRIWSERSRIVEDSRELARQLAELADGAAERFPPAEDEEDVATGRIERARGSAESGELLGQAGSEEGWQAEGHEPELSAGTGGEAGSPDEAVGYSGASGESTGDGGPGDEPAGDAGSQGEREGEWVDPAPYAAPPESTF